MKYAKLIDGCPIYAASCVLIESNYVYNPAEAQLLSSGYLPVIETVPPETDERHYAEPHWAIENNQIVQSWTVEEIPITEEEALTRYANELTGADDPDLISATETLIQQRMEEK